MAKKRFYDNKKRASRNESYAGMRARDAQEARDWSMIWEDRNAVANLPQEVIYKAYPKNDGSLSEGLNDTITGIDRQISIDKRKMLAKLSPEKY